MKQKSRELFLIKYLYALCYIQFSLVNSREARMPMCV